MDIRQKKESLEKKLQGFENIVVAYSGGIDSSLLLKISHRLKKDKVIALIVKSPFVANFEYENAISFCKEIGVNYKVINVNMHDLAPVKHNPEDRCYICKTLVFTEIINEAKKLGFNTIVDGSNASDTGDYRPGKKALKELGIISPFLECDITKDEIRIFSKEEKISFYNKPSNSCLATRIPYNNEITEQKLNQIELSEDYIRKFGINVVRLRHYDHIAIIEVGRDEREKLFDIEKMDKIEEFILKLGFKFVTINIAGYKTGNLNKLINIEENNG
ncbi:MAG: TIGR00268 family protein [Spirochaetes bacterium GWD1_27_9]|nr:MAG: TIGR00268 family protein [Spirochaetes bacterium GWB1_27_13]OHD22642.1 MAG: TIGR00268 family protein [Spirochaetes bacterium GWC1_27_15]OHD38147.1 MAG: TIGR00268 family protein [Spirochaetes bacterium GWD1_27_9]